MTATFITEQRLLDGPWQAFERDIARLLIFKRFEDVRLVGGPGDKGADVLGVRGGELWVWQCKHTRTQFPPKDAIREVYEAARHYGAQRMALAVSRQPNDAFNNELARYRDQGFRIDVATPPLLLQLAASCADYPPTRRTLYPYQEDVSSKLRMALQDTGRAQIVMATGLGKTVVMAEAVADMLRDNRIPNGRVLVLAHTTEIVSQLHRQFWNQLPKRVPTHQLGDGERPSFWDGITFATIQTVRNRLDTLPEFGLIVVDEAHHVGAEMFQRAIRTLKPPMLAGATATPWRGDGYDIDLVLGPRIVEIGIPEGLSGGFLSEVDYRLLADNVDWEFVQSASAYRYSLPELNRRLIIPTRDDEAARIVRGVFDSEHRRSGIVFSPSIEHARAFAAALRRYSFKAEVISSEDEPRDRYLILARLRSGQLHFVTTVDLFNEGVDVPDVDILVFLRSTHSRRIFVQQLGRGLRVTPSKKKVVVLDFVTDIRRIAEVIELDRKVRSAEVERVGLGSRLLQFSDRSAGTFMREWMLDQADLLLRQDDPRLELPELNFPEPPAPGGVE